MKRARSEPFHYKYFHVSPERNPKKLPRTVVIVGLVSLLNDFASEMVVPLIPLLLATMLAAGPVALGLIEGVADTVSNLLKLWAGGRIGICPPCGKTHGVTENNMVPHAGWMGGQALLAEMPGRQVLSF